MGLIQSRLRIVGSNKIGLIQSRLRIIGRKNDMNTDIDDSDCIVVQKGGGEVRKRSVEVTGSPDPPNADASALSPEAGERAEDSRGG
jgi:hypothetical protein